MKKLNLLIFLSMTSLFGQSQTMDWVSVPNEFNDMVDCLAVYDGELIAGGHFFLSGQASVNRIASWDGNIWSAMGNGPHGGVNPFVLKLLEFNGDLIVAGNFDSVDTFLAHDIAKWNGSTWSAMGSGSNGAIHSMAIYNNELYVGGVFDSIGGIFANHIAKWNGTSWEPLLSGVQGANVNDLQVYQGELYAVGGFDSADSVPCNYIARWNGSVWDTVNGGVEYGNTEMIEWNGKLLVGAELYIENFEGFQRMQTWDSTTWEVFSVQTMPDIRNFHIHDNKLYCAGQGGPSQDSLVSFVYVWNDTIWESVGTGLNRTVSGFCNYNGEMYCCGVFNHNDYSPHQFIARYTIVDGIDEHEDDNLEFSVFPIPSSGNYTINMKGFHGGKIISLADINGKVLLTMNTLRENIDIEISMFKPGVYFLTVSDNEVTKSVRLILNR